KISPIRTIAARLSFINVPVETQRARRRNRQPTGPSRRCLGTAEADRTAPSLPHPKSERDAPGEAVAPASTAGQGADLREDLSSAADLDHGRQVRELGHQHLAR